MSAEETTPELVESIARMEKAVETIDDNLAATWEALHRLAELLRADPSPSEPT